MRLPRPGALTYVAEDRLAHNAKDRFAQLLRIKPTWELAEIAKFLEPVRKGAKVEGLVMKYGRKKTMGKKVIVTAR